MKYPIFYAVPNYQATFIKCYKVGKIRYVPCYCFKSSKIRNLKSFAHMYCLTPIDYNFYKTKNQAKKYIIKIIDKKINKLQEKRQTWE